jgi:hypothetical protein
VSRSGVWHAVPLWLGLIGGFMITAAAPAAAVQATKAAMRAACMARARINRPRGLLAVTATSGATSASAAAAAAAAPSQRGKSTAVAVAAAVRSLTRRVFGGGGGRWRGRNAAARGAGAGGSEPVAWRRPCARAATAGVACAKVLPLLLLLLLRLLRASRFLLRRLGVSAALGCAFVCIVWSPDLFSEASFGALISDGWHTGAKLGAAAGVAHLVLRARSGGGARRAVQGCSSYMCSAVAASAGALGLLLLTPAWHARTLTIVGSPRCVAGAVFTECTAHYGGGGTNPGGSNLGGSNPSSASSLAWPTKSNRSPSPSAKLTLRRRRYGEPLEVEWEALAPADVEIVARVRPLSSPGASGLLLDDGLGVTPHSWKNAKISTPANTLPSGAFAALRGGSRLGVVLLGRVGTFHNVIFQSKHQLTAAGMSM